MDSKVCVNCINKNCVNTTDNRLVTESCGHVKCMQCLLQETSGCTACKKERSMQNNDSPDQNGLKTVPDRKKSRLERISHVEELAEDLESENGLTKLDEALQTEAPLETEENQTQEEESESRRFKLNTSHVIITKDGDKKQFSCTLCKRKFSARSQVSYHAYCNGQKKPFECKDCNKSFAILSHYKYHRQSKHPPTPNFRGDYRCKICDARFIQRSKLDRHSLRHTKEKKYSCLECGALFSNRCSLRKHGLVHSGRQPHACPHCQRRFRDTSNLNKHVRNRHTTGSRLASQEPSERTGLFANRKHQCARCPQAFHTRKDLRRHENIHTEDKQLFTCQIRDMKCKQPRFSRRDNYNRHLRNTHGVIVPLAGDAPNGQNGTSPVNVTGKITDEIQEKAKLEVLNPLPPLPDEVMQKHLYTEVRIIDNASELTIDKIKKRVIDDKSKPDVPIAKLKERVIDKSYIIEANNARESVICKAQERKASSPAPAYVHKLKIAHTFTHKEVCLPPIDTRKLEELVKLYPHSKEESPRSLDVCDIRVKDVQTLKNILHDDRRQRAPPVHWRKKRLAPDSDTNEVN